jgi:hypothetical protein
MWSKGYEAMTLTAAIASSVIAPQWLLFGIQDHEAQAISSTARWGFLAALFFLSFLCISTSFIIRNGVFSVRSQNLNCAWAQLQSPAHVARIRRVLDLLWSYSKHRWYWQTTAFQDPVRAAIHGHLLILDRLQTAERNVLPTLNNLLENRELPLEDGWLLVFPQRYAHHSTQMEAITCATEQAAWYW